MTLLVLFLHLMSMAPSRVKPEDVPSIVEDANGVAESAEDRFLVSVFAVCESAGRPDAVGDSGAAVGALQLHREWWKGHGRDEILSSRPLAMELWLSGLREARKICGSTQSALGLIAGGKCNARPALVERRMAGKC